MQQQQFEEALAWYRTYHMPLGPVSVEDVDRLSEFKQLFTIGSVSTDPANRSTVVTGSKRVKKPSLSTKRAEKPLPPKAAEPASNQNGTPPPAPSGALIELLKTEARTAEDLGQALHLGARQVRAQIKRLQATGVRITEGEQKGGRGRPKTTYGIALDSAPSQAS